MDSMAQFVLGAGVNAAFHPIAYTKILIQLGHEPIGPQPTRTVFGRNVLAYPNVFKYMGHIRKTDGFLGLYKGLGARLTGGIVGSFVTNAVSKHFKEHHQSGSGSENEDSTKEIDGVEVDHIDGLKRLMRDTTHEMIARCAGAIASQPFHVIMIRTMAQFVGKETKYNGVISAVTETYKQDGIMGFFLGLAPRLLGEAITLWLANVLSYLVNTYLIPKDKAGQGLNRLRFLNAEDAKSYTNAVCHMLVTQVTYPFSLVSNIMVVSNSGLAAGSPPYMADFGSWRGCWSELSQAGQLKRGSSLFWRYYKGPTMMMADGTLQVARL